MRQRLFEEAHLYNGFNLIVTDFPSESMVYVTNRPRGDSDYVSKVSPGIHVLSNASLDSPWPKVNRICKQLVGFLIGIAFLHRSSPGSEEVRASSLSITASRFDSFVNQNRSRD